VIWQTAEARPAHPETRVHCELRSPVLDYYKEALDPHIVLLRRQDGMFVAAFSARGGLLEAAKEDYFRVIEADADL
jgi:hypothetical protein